MKVFKRYSNRKLYDTEERAYISLDDITTVIQSGEDFQVLDHDTGADLTTLVLLQMMLEQEKRISGFLPQSILKRIAQAGWGPLENLRSSAASFLTPLLNHDVEIQHRIQKLAARGLISAIDAKRWEQLLVGFFSEENSAESHFEEISTEIPAQTKKTTNTDLETLSQRIQELESKLDDFLTKKGQPG